MTLLVAGGDVVTMNRAREVLIGGSVAVDGDQIVAVGTTRELRARYPQAEVLDASGCVVTPGMVNAHQHTTGDPLVRSCIPDQVDTHEAIFGWAVPVHAAHSAADDELSATLLAVESVRNGVTCLVEAGTVAHPDRVASGLARVGLRGTVGTWGWDIDDAPFAAPADEVLDRQRAVLGAYPKGGLVEGWVTLVGHDLASDALLAGAADLARRAGVGMTMHLSPTPADAESYLARTGSRPVVHLDHLGVLGHHLLLAHCVHLDDAELDLVLASGTAVASCPWAYLRLGQGMSRAGRHAELVERGGRVALGADASNAGDVADLLRVAALFAGLARDTRPGSLAFGAHDAFALATIAGAEAIGMAGRIGSLEAGKQADVVVHDAAGWGWSPRGDVGLQLVWGSDGRSVRDVLVAGKAVVRNGRCVTVDVEALHAEAREAQVALLARAGLEVPHRWPQIDAR